MVKLATVSHQLWLYYAFFAVHENSIAQFLQRFTWLTYVIKHMLCMALLEKEREIAVQQYAYN